MSTMTGVAGARGARHAREGAARRDGDFVTTAWRIERAQPLAEGRGVAVRTVTCEDGKEGLGGPPAARLPASVE